MQLLIAASGLLALATVVVAGGEEMKAMAQACMEESGATEEELKSMKSNPTDLSENASCFMGCMAEKNGVFQNGAFNITNLLAKIDDEEKKEEMKKCVDGIDVSAGKCSISKPLMACMAKAGVKCMAPLPQHGNVN